MNGHLTWLKSFAINAAASAVGLLILWSFAAGGVLRQVDQNTADIREFKIALKNIAVIAEQVQTNKHELAYRRPYIETIQALEKAVEGLEKR